VRDRGRHQQRRRQRRPRKRHGDYRIFVGAFLGGRLAEDVQALREQYDWKSSQISQPHVSLAGTYWRQGTPNAASEARLIRQLAASARQLKPFQMELGGVYTFGRRVIYLGVTLSEEMEHIRHILKSVIGRDKHRRYRPHLTLAMRLEEPEQQAMLAELAHTSWHTERFTAPIHELQLMQRGSQDPAWRCISVLPLQG
jgi:2'-5' RNA ligase